jgi:hypothetical protein
LEGEGTVDDKGKIEFKVTKLTKASDEFKKSSGAKNIVGLKVSGTVDGTRFKGRYVWPVAEDITAPPRRGVVELKLKD